MVRGTGIPSVVVQLGAAAVPPIALLAAVHGIALAVRAGASGRVYCCAIGAVSAIGVGAFALSFLALRDLMQVIGHSSEIACIFPAIIDTAVAISTLMLVALGDKPGPRARTGTASASTPSPTLRRLMQPPAQGAKDQVRGFAPGGTRVPTSASVQANQPHAVQASAHIQATQDDAKIAPVDADLASELIASGVTTQPLETVIAVLEAHRDGASINAAAKASGINYRTAQRIVEERPLVAVG
jgi:Protein of unknown function (DUF2637)